MRLSQTLGVLNREKIYRKAVYEEQERYQIAVADAKKSYENNCIDALRDYWQTSITIGCDNDKNSLDIDTDFSTALNQLCNDYNFMNLGAGNVFNTGVVSAAITASLGDTAATDSFLTSILGDYFSDAHTAAGSISGAVGNYYNGNISIAETLSAATQNNATVLENALIAQAGAMATAENSAAFLLAWTTAFAYSAYTAELVTATETAATSANNSSKQFSQQEAEHRVTYLRAVASAEWNAAKEKAQATNEYGKDQIDFAADTVIDWYSELIYCSGCDDDNEHHTHNSSYGYYSYYYYNYGYYGYYSGNDLISGYHDYSYSYYYYDYYSNIWGLNLNGST